MKKRVSLIGFCIIFFIGMMGESFGNIQIQVKSVKVNEVFFVEGEDVVTGEPIIRPTMNISWENPSSWAPAEAPNYHTPDYYDVVVTNITRGNSNTIRVDEGSEEFTDQMMDIHEHIKLDTGSLYNIEVKPYHLHTLAGGGTELAVNSGLAENAYAITDLNVSFETTESSIQVTWDDLGSADFTYSIYYALGDYSSRTRQNMIDNKEGEITALTPNSSGVERFYDPVSKRNKLSYTIEGNVYPGQIYSVLVEPTVEYFNSEPVMRNRNYPLIRTCSTNVNLSLYEEGDYLRLEWEVPGSFKVGQNQDQYAMVEATLLQYRNGQSSNVAIFDGDAATIGYYKVPKPLYETEYEIRFVYKAVSNQAKPPIEPVSNRVSYIPADVLITPTKPVVPNVFSEAILDDLKASLTTEQIRQELANKYFVPGYTYAGSLDNVLSMNTTFRVLDNNLGFNFVWGAFKRIDVDVSSSTYNQYIYDHNVYYDIWVTDSLESMAFATKVVDDRRYGANNSNNNITNGTTIYGYSQELGYYYDGETGELEQIIPDKLYYIKIVAKKRTAGGNLISEPTIVSLYYTYDGDTYEPPIITKPPLEVKDSDTTSTSVSITWKESWWEVISMGTNDVNNPLYIWRHEVWVGADRTVYSEKTPNTTYFPIYQGLVQVNAFKAYMAGYDDTIEGRKVDLGQDAYGVSDIQYKFLRIPYAQVLERIEAEQELDPTYDFNDYYLDMIKADKNGTGILNWVDITPINDPDDDSRILYNESGLLPNTSYMFMLYPYRQTFSGEILYAHYPTPIVVSTEPDEVIVHPDPTVPNLYVTNYTDTSITVSWKYNTDFEYELVYSLFEDITKALPVNFTVGTTPLDPLFPINGEYYEVTVDQLFPNTNYYFWIRAKNPNTNKTSAWSNATHGRTRDVEIPFPPRGFGIASLENMKLHGYDASVTKDYIAVEWVLDINDIEDTGNNQKITKNYSYVLEIADNREFIDKKIVESTGGQGDIVPENGLILEKNLVMIQELQPNRPYYLRVKTKITVKGGEGQIIVKESTGYSPIIRVITVASEDEYDGSIDPDTTVLPSEDYEIIYNPDTDTLDFRFRDDGVGADGLPDNNVDQRLINELMQQNIFTYTIDVSNYKNQPIKSRNISIPYSILEAFTTYKVSVFINAGDLQIQMPYGSFGSALNQQVKQYSAKPTVNIAINTLDSETIKKNLNQSNLRMVGTPMSVAVSVNSSKLNNKLNYTDKEITVQMKVNNAYEAFRVNRIGTIKDYQGTWHQVPSVYNGTTGMMTYKTAKVGTYAGYVLDDINAGITSDKGHWSESARKAVTAEYNLIGLAPYNANAVVPENELLNIVYGFLIDNNNINLDAYITNNVFDALQYSGIKTNNTMGRAQISREEAISILTRAYEITNDKIIIPSSQTLGIVSKDTKIGSSYKNLMSKAATVGLISDIGKSRPKDSIKYGEMFAILAKLIN